MLVWFLNSALITSILEVICGFFCCILRRFNDEIKGKIFVLSFESLNICKILLKMFKFDNKNVALKLWKNISLGTVFFWNCEWFNKIQIFWLYNFKKIKFFKSSFYDLNCKILNSKTWVSHGPLQFFNV